MRPNVFQSRLCIWPQKTSLKKNAFCSCGRGVCSDTLSRNSSNNNNRALLIAAVWPENRSSAAGVRSWALIRMLQQHGFEMTCVSPAKPTMFTHELEQARVSTVQIRPNDNYFDSWIQSEWHGVQSADVSALSHNASAGQRVVIFDQFITEEMFGWRVRAQCPKALRVVDTQDLHFLRKHRQHHMQNLDWQRCWSSSSSEAELCEVSLDIPDPQLQLLHAEWLPLTRELASMHRSDLVLVVSSFEKQLLQTRFGVSSNKIHLSPFFYDFAELPQSSSSPEQEFLSRTHFATIGHFGHPPNHDSILLLRHVLWPAIRSRIPNAELHVYGAHPTAEHLKLTDSSTGFFVKGPTPDAIKTLAKYRVLLAPLRFGAGIKGKIADAWAAGLPVVTTPIGMEGMHRDSSHSSAWGGLSASNALDFVRNSVNLYQSQHLWAQCRQEGMQLLRDLFDYSYHSASFIQTLKRGLQTMESQRASDWTGGILWDASHRNTESMSRYIELKQQLSSLKRSNDSNAVSSV